EAPLKGPGRRPEAPLKGPGGRDGSGAEGAPALQERAPEQGGGRGRNERLAGAVLPADHEDLVDSGGTRPVRRWARGSRGDRRGSHNDVEHLKGVRGDVEPSGLGCR